MTGHRRQQLLNEIKKILEQELERRSRLKVHYDWEAKARDNQRIPEGDWHTWLILAGRGFGKTRTGAEAIRHWVNQKHYRNIAIIGASLHEA